MACLALEACSGSPGLACIIYLSQSESVGESLLECDIFCCASWYIIELLI